MNAEMLIQSCRADMKDWLYTDAEKDAHIRLHLGIKLSWARTTMSLRISQREEWRNPARRAAREAKAAAVRREWADGLAWGWRHPHALSGGARTRDLQRIDKILDEPSWGIEDVEEEIRAIEEALQMLPE